MSNSDNRYGSGFQKVSDGADFDVIIVGAGISGIGAGIELLRRGNASFLLLEAGAEPGGTWRDNSYPGVAVDIPSVSYSFPFATTHAWSRTYAPGAEILRYVKNVADTYGVTAHIRFGARVVRSVFDDARDRWVTTLEGGGELTSRFLIAATGILSQPKLPDSPGLDSFAGTMFHTAHWRHDHDLTGERVAVIGTGASAVQFVPEIARHVSALLVFQRTPIWVSPKFDRALAPATGVSVRQSGIARSLRRFGSEAWLEALYFAVVNYRRFPFMVRALERTMRRWMMKQVDDPGTARKLLPDYGFGCKRPAISNEYLKTFNRANVRLITSPIVRVQADGVVTADGATHAVDTIVLATGFLTTERGNAPSFEVTGTDGVTLARVWEEHGRQSYAGVSLPGFPNFFLTAGPYSGGLNWFTMLSAHLRHIMACIDEAHGRGATRVEVSRAAHDRYMQRMRRRADGTVFRSASCGTANSYYIDSRGEASLPFPHTPLWRAVHGRLRGTQDYRFTSASAR